MIEFRYFGNNTDTDDTHTVFGDGTLLGVVEDGEITSVEEDTTSTFGMIVDDRISSFDDIVEIINEDTLNGVIDPVSVLQFRGIPYNIRAGIPVQNTDEYVWDEFQHETVSETTRKILNNDCALGPVETHEFEKYQNIDSTDPYEPVFKEYETDKQYVNARVLQLDRSSGDMTYVGTLNIQSDTVTDGDSDKLRELIRPVQVSKAPSLNPVGLLVGNRGSTTRTIQIIDPDTDTVHVDPSRIKRNPNRIVAETNSQ